MENKKIKILRIITRLNIGGPAIHAVLLAKELNNDEFESELICGRISEGEGDMGYLADIYGVKPVYIDPLKREINPFRDVVAFYRIFRKIRGYKPDIVHTHTAKAGTLGRLAAILANVPAKVHTFHGTVFEGYFNKISTRFFIFVEKILARFTDRIIAISSAQKDDIVRKYRITSPEKCRVVKLGFELGKFLDSERKKSIFRKRFNFREDDVLVGMVGRLTSIKNHMMFIDAAGYIDKHAAGKITDKIKFIIVGDGELKNELLSHTRKRGLDKKIFFTGWVKDIEEAYADLDIVALSSISEGTPVSLIEAMASEKPVVSTDVGGVKDAVGGIGVLTKMGDYKAMGDKILKLASLAEEREILGRRGRNFVKDIYSKERLVSELSEFYKKLLKKKGRTK